MKTIVVSGKRKSAIARATITPGKGLITVNGIALDHYGTALLRMRIQEPLILAGKMTEKVNISVNVTGGGASGQSDAARLAIARGLSEHTPALKQVFLEYDRTLLVADVRQKESRKPNSQGQARAKRQKSYR